MNGCLLQDHKIIGTKPNSVTVFSALLVLNLNPLQSSPVTSVEDYKALQKYEKEKTEKQMFFLTSVKFFRLQT